MCLFACNTHKQSQLSVRAHYPVKQKIEKPILEVSLSQPISETTNSKRDITTPAFIKTTIPNVKANANITYRPDPELSKQEKKKFKKQAKTLIKVARRESGPEYDDKFILCVILAFLLPPLSVYLYENSLTINFWVDLLLTLIFWIPGIIFALLVIYNQVNLQ
ncbi:MAG: YqaE/Pmp3 family membrane protein [Cytophagales bacterium]|nr:YqaE/Pmp3 family membrane protein [Cytophagales bacterium]